MLNINKEYLKEIIKEVLFKEVPCVSKEQFIFQFNNDDRESITYVDIIEQTYGADCWGNEQKTEKTEAYSFNEGTIGKIINEFVIEDYEFSSFNLNKDDVDFLCDYHDNFVPEYDFGKFIYSEEENINEDYYYNNDRLRTFIIDINAIADYLLTFKYTKPFEEIIKSINLTNQELEDIKNRPHIIKEILNESLDNNNKNNKKIKI